MKIKSLQRAENDRLLDIFWRKSTNASRWGRRDLLRRWECVTLTTIDPSIRVEKRKVRNRHLEHSRAPICWCCRREAETQRHHILTVAHGGLSIRRNLVDICTPCHRDIHRRYGADDRRIDALVEATTPNCTMCGHRLDGMGGMCSKGWCRCVCREQPDEDTTQEEIAQALEINTKSPAGGGERAS